MPTKLLYFAWVREGVGINEEMVELPPDLATAAQLVRWLATRGEGYSAVFADRAKLRCAADHVMLAWDAPLGRPTEIAFFPPVTGG